jgi:hypothetical protein
MTRREVIAVLAAVIPGAGPLVARALTGASMAAGHPCS